ncbi:low-density lipoprotein receptor-like isoform 1-T1 [Menidia menidia]
MGHLGGLFLLIAPLFWHNFLGAEGHSFPACQEQLDFRCSDGSCLSRLKMCDGHLDCEDGSDERHCSRVWCKDGEFACHSGRCMSTELLCNGVDDCGNGRDEGSCHHCTAGFFSCGPSDDCLPGEKLCDGRADCADGRDESRELCGSAQPSSQASSPCAASEFQCGDGECIRHSWRCDHQPDCTDGSDEEHCGQNECQVNNGGCSHFCVDQKMGFLCRCPDNMKLVDDSQCEEVDTCLERDVCDQLCAPNNGIFKCDCHDGYQMTPATGECKAKGAEAQLVFTASTGIQFAKHLSSDYKPLAPHVSGPGAVAVVASNHTLFWAQQGYGSIYRISVNEKPHKAVLVLKAQGSVSAIAVDWIHSLLYWTSQESGSVSVALLDGSSQHQLIGGLEKPSAVAVDPLQGLLFWTQCGSSPKIERASLDGHDRKTLVTTAVRQPVALSLDVPRRLLYWFDMGTRSISRVDLEGRHRKTVVESNGYLDRLFGLAVFEGFVYWSDEVTHSICRANKHNGTSLQVLLSDIASPGGVAIIQPVLQPKESLFLLTNSAFCCSKGPSACGRPGMVCEHKCAVDLLTERLQFSCISPAISRALPEATLSNPSFAGILSLIVFLSALLVGMAVWWWREEFLPSRSLTVQTISLTESQDPLIQRPPVRPITSLVKETLKLDLDGE